MYISVILVLAYSIIMIVGVTYVEYRIYKNKQTHADTLFNLLRILSATILGICIIGLLKHYQILP